MEEKEREKMKKSDKAEFKAIMFLLNLLLIGVVLGISTQLGFEIYLLTAFGIIGWIMFSTPIFFKNWGKSLYEFGKTTQRR